MAKVIAVNGSPRKNYNTGTLINEALKGAQAANAETKLYNLYDLQYKGCISCFVCKRKGQTQLSKCFMKDELTEVLEQIMESDVLILGSPIYFGDITGAMRSFMERLYFSNLSYDSMVNRSVYQKTISTGFIYTMGVSPEQYEQVGYDSMFRQHKMYMGLLNGRVEQLLSKDAYQFDNYNDYAASVVDVAQKEKVRAEQFPIDCKKAFELGFSLVNDK